MYKVERMRLGRVKDVGRYGDAQWIIFLCRAASGNNRLSVLVRECKPLRLEAVSFEEEAEPKNSDLLVQHGDEARSNHS